MGNGLRNILIFYLLSFIWFSIFASPVSASAKFSVSFDLTYQVKKSEETTVTQNFILTNLTSEYSPGEYVAVLPKDHAYNLRAYDRNGPLDVEVKEAQEAIGVHIKLPQTAGINKTILWTFVYESVKIAKRAGRLWEVFIPRPPLVEETTNYTVGLSVPESFGSPVILKPVPWTYGLSYIWGADEIGKATGIYATFAPTGAYSDGDLYQAFDFKLHYGLYNLKLYPVSAEIALPPDTNYQKIFLYSLLPRPVNVRLDNDGNWLARYDLGPIAKMDVVATGSAAVKLRPKFISTSGSDMASYLSPQEFWEKDDPAVAALAQKLSTPKKIYDYVVSRLQFNPSRPKGSERLGAKRALENSGSAGPLEFADLFIALARSAGIPAREVDGFLTEKNAMHTWPEYFDKEQNRWVMVDPFRGAATAGLDYFSSLDFNHLTLAIKGERSDSPAVAGTYKYDNNGQDIEISYREGELDIDTLPHLAIRPNFPQKIVSGFPSSASVAVENNGPVVFQGAQLTIRSGSLDLLPRIVSTGTLLPFGNISFNFNFAPLGFLEEKNDIITLDFLSEERQFKIAASPIYKNKFFLSLFILITLGIVSVIAQITRSLFLQRQKGRNNLHREGKKSA